MTAWITRNCQMKLQIPRPIHANCQTQPSVVPGAVLVDSLGQFALSFGQGSFPRRLEIIARTPRQNSAKACPTFSSGFDGHRCTWLLACARIAHNSESAPVAHGKNLTKEFRPPPIPLATIVSYPAHSSGVHTPASVVGFRGRFLLDH